jgi:predicted deacetylase
MIATLEDKASLNANLDLIAIAAERKRFDKNLIGYFTYLDGQSLTDEQLRKVINVSLTTIGEMGKAYQWYGKRLIDPNFAYLVKEIIEHRLPIPIKT